ncbi:MAG: nucleotidyltransferase family protein [Ruminococcus sp.]|jgi:dTDP-glucose pyrophosphorylase
MKKTALVIMAAGIGSRFGKGIKQLEPVGPSGEIIMDYSIHDALEAGFDKVVFIIRKDLEKDFREIIGNRIEKLMEVQYAFQELDDLPEGFTKPEGRKKPWGTGQAVLCCKDILQEPFVVINADDYYGKEPFVRLHDYLVHDMEEKSAKLSICMAGFTLGNTLSDNGGVTRGICRLDDNGCLAGIEETKNIVKTKTGAAVDGPEGMVPVELEAKVSMNMWGLTPAFLEVLERGFREFLENLSRDEEKEKAEYLLPTIIDGLLREGKAEVKVIDTNAQWFGVTYQEDKAAVVEAFRQLIAQGVYREKLFQQ